MIQLFAPTTTKLINKLPHLDTGAPERYFHKRDKQRLTATVTFDAPAGAEIEDSSRTTLYHDMSYECIHLELVAWHSWKLAVFGVVSLGKTGIMACLDYLFGDLAGKVEHPLASLNFCTASPHYIRAPLHTCFWAWPFREYFIHINGPVAHLSQGDAICVPVDLWIRDSGTIYPVAILSFGM